MRIHGATTIATIVLAATALAGFSSPAIAASPRASSPVNAQACNPSGICLVATVGSDLSPDACGVDHAIDAQVGEQVNFCYTVTNNTGFELGYQTLMNDVDGMLFELESHAIAPGASFQYNRIATVGETKTYNATWTARDVLPHYTSEVDTGACDRIFADGFDDDLVPCSDPPGFIDIRQTGVALGIGDEDNIDVALPFAMPFYGTSAGVMTISNNGGVLLGSPGAVLDWENTALPAQLAGPALLPLWDDFDGTSGEVYVEKRGVAPNRQAIVEWFDRVHYDGTQNSDGATFEVILNENGRIQFEYDDVGYTAFAPGSASDPEDCTNGLCATVGLQGALTASDQFSAFEASLASHSGITWSATLSQAFASSDSVTVNIGAPAIVVNPSPIEGTLQPGDTTTIPFAIENHGDRNLFWNLSEAPSSKAHFAPPGTRYAMPMGDPSKSTIGRAPFARAPKPQGRGADRIVFANGLTAFAADAFVDAFETLDVTTDNGVTNVGGAQGTAFGLKYLDGDFGKAFGIDKFGSMADTFAMVESDGTITPLGTSIPVDGDGWSGFAQDPTTGVLYAASTSCSAGSHLYTIDRNSGFATLVGELPDMPCVIWIAVDSNGLMYAGDIATDSLYAVDKTTGETSLKGSIGFNANFGQDADFDQATGTLYWAAYNVDTDADEIRTVDLDTGATTLVYSLGNTQIVGLATQSVGVPCLDPEDIPWLSIDSMSDMTPPSGATPLVATIDATGAAAGDVLSGFVCAFSNDPAHPLLPTPITVTVGGAPSSPPTVQKAFNPPTVDTGAVSTLTITLGNANGLATALTAPLTDTFPAGLVLATPANASTTCGGNVTTNVGADVSITLDSAGASIPATGTCTVTVDVQAAAAGDYLNVIAAGALATMAGSNAAAAQATLTVNDVAPIVPPTVAMAIAPAFQSLTSTSSTLTLTFANANAADVLALTSPFVDTLPAGLVIATPANPVSTCANTAMDAVDGSGSIVVDPGMKIPASDTCTISVDVTAANEGIYSNTLAAGAVATNGGANAQPALAIVQFGNVVTLGADFESPFVAGAWGGQQGWFAQGVTAPAIDTATPANGAQNATLFATSSTSTPNFPWALSPVGALGTSPFSMMSANIRISHNTNGASWDFTPFDAAAQQAVTTVRFDKGAAHNILLPDKTQAGAFVATGATWTADTYFNFAVVVDRASGALDLCVDGASVYHDDTGKHVTGSNVTQADFRQFLQSGSTAANTFLVDDVMIANAETGGCF
ncbi:MAG TPA: hypothetical protein VJ696_03195 [Rhodanobacteraceae bacterium]|nr:hypothetical protein [Rhodanobacteraceae bacterium]